MKPEQPSYPLLLARCGDEFRGYSTLPMAVCVTAADGAILDANEAAQRLFHWEPEAFGRLSIADFYGSPGEREEILERIRSLPEGHWAVNQKLRYTVRDRSLHLRFFAKPFFSGASFLGSLCIMFQISENEQYSELEDLNPSGIFEIDASGQLSYANNKFRQLFAYGPSDPIAAGDLFSESGSFEALLKELKESPFVRNKQIVFRRKDQSHFIGSINVSKEVDARQAFLRARGTIEDITFDSISKDVPIGLYFVITNSNNEEIILSANNQFAEISGLRNSKECEGKLMSSFHKDELSYKNFRKQLAEADQTKAVLKNLPITIKTGQGNKDILVHVKSLSNADGKTIKGRVGAIYDVTDDIQRKFSEWEMDFASFFHSYAAISLSIKDSLQAMLMEQARNLVRDERLIIASVVDKLTGSINGLQTTITGFLKLALERQLVTKESAEAILLRAKGYHARRGEAVKVMTTWVRHQTINIRDKIHNEVRTELMPKELTRALQNELNEVLRYSRLLTFDWTVSELDEILIDIDVFKEALLVGNMSHSRADSIGVADVLRSIIRNLDAFASRAGIEIRFPSDDRTACCLGNERFLYNALYNIVHNAIKYSWKKGAEADSWIDVRLHVRGDEIGLEVENWGVPIIQEEIDSQLVFEYGYRGAKSSDRNRPGSGIGLWYSRKIITIYGGTIAIQSESTGYNHPTDYTKPFKTTVRVCLPKTAQR